MLRIWGERCSEREVKDLLNVEKKNSGRQEKNS
jgi:hypothetical protein